MNKNIALAWLITMLMTMVCSQAFAGSSQNLTMQDGETRTLYLPGEVTGKKFHSATYSSYGTSYVQILSVASDMRSVRVQALQPTSGSRITVQCTYKYFSTIGSFSQLVTGYYNFYILVEEVKPTSISISSSLPLTVGESSRLYASVSPSNAQYTLTWSSGNSSIAKVDQKGTVTGVSEGSTTITVKTNNGKSADCEVTVSPRSVKDVSIDAELPLEVGDTYTLTPVIIPSDIETTFTWSSNNDDVATVSATGEVTAVSEGDANITVETDNGKKSTCKVTVSPKSVKDVSIDAELPLEVGNTYTLTPVVTPSDAETTFTWSSDNDDVATVSETGEVTAISEGDANITVETDNGKKSTCKVTVSPKSVKDVSIDAELPLEVGNTYTLTPVVTPSDAETTFTWSSDNDDVATVSETGEVTAISEGDANITVETDNGKTATCKVSVKISEISGDANGDKEVNVADIVKLVNDHAPQADIETVVKIIMKKE